MATAFSAAGSCGHLQQHLWKVCAIMSLTIGSGRCPNWRLGPDADPGQFDTSATASVPGQFVVATVFRLHWQLQPGAPDSIYNVLHAVTMGRSGHAHKIHVEQLAQILQGDLHVTCRITDRTGRVQRNTVALPGTWQDYQDRDLLLIYTANAVSQDPVILHTRNVLYDLDNWLLLQDLPHTVELQHPADVNFASWPNNTVICDHEQRGIRRDHVMIHGFCLQHDTPFELHRVWGSLDQTLDSGHIHTVHQFAQVQIPDHIGPAQAWYNCCSDNAVTQGQDCWARCTGRYYQRQSLGIRLGTGPEMLHAA